MKSIVKLCIMVLICSLTAIIYCNSRIVKQAKNKIYNNVNTIPRNKVGLLLGTGKYLKNGKINPYYIHRIQATAELYKANKIEKIIISGDNSTENYNEPQTMMDDLIAQGIEEKNIYLDFAGFRTLDSMYRTKAIFGQQNITVISQKFHNERAIYIADYLGINAIGYNAKDVSTTQGLKTNAREKLARVKVFIDHILNVKPKFLGEPIVIK